MSKKHGNISIFVPHNGCPNQCSFCNQKKITGCISQPTVEEVDELLYDAAKKISAGMCMQIAFFGGSFTAINRDYMTDLLDIAYKYVKNNSFDSIRISTRPDCISYDILDILESRGVKDIELGCQSMDDEVLIANKRGHTKKDVIEACNKIKNYGFRLGLQMMTGLYKSTPEKDLQTAYDIIEQKPDTVRIYPTVVMKDTELCKLYQGGFYRPFDIDETVKLCAKLLILFEENKINVIRLGLHYSDELKNNAVAGAFHPSLGEMCESEKFFTVAFDFIKKYNVPKGTLCIQVAPCNVSKMIGHRRINIEKFASLGYGVKVEAVGTLKKNDVKIYQC